MKKIFELIKTKKSVHYIIIAIVGLLVSIPLMWLQVRATDDGFLHLLRLIGIDNAINNVSFPFLVQPFFCNDWGYSMTAFYPTIVSYVPYFLGLIVGTFANGIKIFASITIILSGIFMYNLLIEVTKKKNIALVSAIIYMVLPYRFEDIYNRFAIGEFTAFVFMPLVFLGLYNLLNGDGKKHYYIAIGAAGLMLSHTISTVYTALFCIFYILLNFKKFLRKDVILKCIVNAIFILLITAIFWVPMLEFESSAHYAIFEPDVLKTSGKYVADNTIELWQLIKDKGEENGVSFVVGIPFITMLLLGVFVYKKLDDKLKDFYMTGILFGIISIFMCTKFFPWFIMPDFLCTVQYPWRLLGVALFFLTPLCAINVCYLIGCIKKENIRNLTYIIVFIIIAGFTAKELSVYKTDNPNLDMDYEQQTISNPKIHYFSVNRDYMPYDALIKQRDYLLVRTDKTYLLNGEAEIENEYKDGLHLELDIKEAKKGTELELPYLYYPGYTVKLVENSTKSSNQSNTQSDTKSSNQSNTQGGAQTENVQTNNSQISSTQTILETSESENGFVKIVIPEDISEAKIIVDYTGTVLEKTAYIVSGISILLFIGYIIYFRIKSKKKIESTD